VARINAQGEADGMRPIVFTTLVNQELATIVHQADAFCLSYFETFLAPLEAELGVKSSHTVGRSHGTAESRITRNASSRSTTRWPTMTASPTATWKRLTSSWLPSRAAARRRPRSTSPCSSA
jgi:hypothetical protein